MNHNDGHGDLESGLPAVAGLDDDLDTAVTKGSVVTPYKGGWQSTGPRCHESHKVLTVGKGELLGASCSLPRPGFDIYVGLDWTMNSVQGGWPWDPPSKMPEHEVHFKVTDGDAPKDKETFKKMVTWLIAQLAMGKRVHVGCIGGHGRTGMLMSAIVAEYLGEKDAIGWVRKNHCVKAVESVTQVKFLMEHYGVDHAKGSKTSWAPTTSVPVQGGYWHEKSGASSKSGKKQAEIYECQAGRGNVWGI